MKLIVAAALVSSGLFVIGLMMFLKALAYQIRKNKEV